MSSNIDQKSELKGIIISMAFFAVIGLGAHFVYLAGEYGFGGSLKHIYLMLTKYPLPPVHMWLLVSPLFAFGIFFYMVGYSIIGITISLPVIFIFNTMKPAVNTWFSNNNE